MCIMNLSHFPRLVVKISMFLMLMPCMFDQDNGANAGDPVSAGMETHKAPATVYLEILISTPYYLVCTYVLLLHIPHISELISS